MQEGPKKVLQDRLVKLREAAGQPTLESIESRARAMNRQPINSAMKPASWRRISDWLNGKSVPANWPQFALVLRALITAAQKKRPTPEVDGLYRLKEWERLWEAAKEKPQLDESDCPYRGLEAFFPEHAHRFFGRTTSTKTFLARLDAVVDTGGLLMVVGSSGVGKSSLLHAGLLPAIAAGELSAPDSSDWPILTTSPGADPIGELSARIPELTAALRSRVEFGGGSKPEDNRHPRPRPADEPTDHDAEGDGTGEDAAVPDRVESSGVDPARIRAAVADHATAHAGPGARLVMIIDQFEELFTLCEDPEQRRRYIETLAAVAEKPSEDGVAPAVVMISLRADFYPRCLEYPVLAAALQDRQMVLAPMTAAELREVITGPAKSVRLRTEDGLVEMLLDDAGLGPTAAEDDQIDVGVLPLISHALSVTWQHRRKNELTVKGYRENGGIHGAVGMTAERAWSEFDSAGQRAAMQLLLRLTHIAEGAGDSDTRRRQDRQQLIDQASDPEAATTALEVLVQARLVSLDEEGRAQLAHEALLRSWPRFVNLIDKHRTELVLRQRVEQDAEAWDHQGRDAGLLYQGARLEDVSSWGAHADLDRPSGLANAFVAASTRQRRRRTWSRRAVAATFVVLAVVAAVAAVVARGQTRDAQFAATLAEADRLRPIDPSLAARLYLVAHEMRPTDSDVDGRLLSTQVSPLAATLPGRSGAIYDIAVAPNQRTLATASYGNTVQLWDLATHQRLGEPIPAGTGYASSAAYSPDSQTLATADEDGSVRLWNIHDPAHPTPIGAPLDGHNGEVYLLDWSPDGHLLAAANSDGSVRLWNVANPARPAPAGAPLLYHRDQVRAVAFSSDGRWLAAGSDDTTVSLWNIADPLHPVRTGPALPGHTGAVHSVAFSPDGRTLASGSDDKTTRLWNIADPQHPTLLGNPLTGQRGAVWSVAFTPDGRTLATGSADGSARLWSITRTHGGIPIGGDLSGATGAVYAVAFTPDGRSLATGGEDGTTQVWSLPPTVLFGHVSRVFALASSPNGRILASGGADHDIRFWDIARPAEPAPLGPPLTGHAGFIYGLGFSPDGQVLASESAQDQQLRVWSVADPAHPVLLGRPIKRATRWSGVLRFSHNGKVLATADTDETVQLWNMADPARPVPIGGPLSGHKGYINAILMTPDDKTMATASSDGTVRLWDIADLAHPALLGIVDPAAGQMFQAAISPDGHMLATTGEDKLLRLWDITDPRRPVFLASLAGHSQLVSSVAFSPDGRTLASGSADSTARLWDISDPFDVPPSTPLSGHTAGVNAVAFTPDGTTLITASEDDNVMLWSLHVDDAIHRICATTPGAITPESSRQTLLSYTPTCGER